MSRILNAGCGFAFWIVAARFYSVTDIGLAVALISSLALVGTFSRLGIDSSLIKFIPSRDRTIVFATSLLTTILSTLIFSIFFLAALKYISPTISFIRDYFIIFIILALIDSMVTTFGSAFLALRKGNYFFFQNLLSIVRIPALLLLSGFGSLGIFLAYGMANIAAFSLAIFPISKIVHLKPEFRVDYIKDAFSISATNYIGDIVTEVPVFLLPIIVLNLLGAEESAMYFVAFSLGNIVLLIPYSVSKSFFIEGGYGIDLKRGSKRAIMLIYLLLLPSVAFIVLFGHILLGFFGEFYLAAIDLLKIYGISSFMVAVYMIYISILNIKMKTIRNLEINLLKFALIVGLSYLFVTLYGFEGIGYAWLIAHIFLCVLILISAERELNIM